MEDKNSSRWWVVVVVFFTLTDRASTIPSNTHTWLPIRYVVCWTEKDQRNIYQAPMRAKEKHKDTENDKEKGTGMTKYTGQKKINEGHSIVYPPNCRTKVGARWSPSFPRQSLARRRARNIVQVHAHALNGSWECYHVVRIGLGAIWGDHGRRRSLHFTTPRFCLKKGWVYPLVSTTLIIFPVQLTTTSRIDNLTRLIHTLAVRVTIHTYISIQ